MIEPRHCFRSLRRTAPAAEDRIGNVYRFDRNEKTTPFPQEHLKAILAAIHPDEIVAYPQLEPFYQKLASWLGVSRDQVLLASGSDTAIKAVYEVYVDEGDEVVMLTPTYGMYQVYCRMFGAKPIDIRYEADMSLPAERILDAIDDDTKLVALANPNHTGTVISEEDLLTIARKALRHEALVLVDEAYFHFYDRTMIRFVDDYENIVIIRTFSKAFGVAPLRIGYTVANKGVVDQLYKAKLTHEITAFAARTGEYLLDHLEIMRDYVQDVNEGKDVLYRRLPRRDCEVLRSEANFAFFKPPEGIDGKQVIRDLVERRIFIKGPFADVPFNGHLRVTVGTASQMEMFCSAVEEIIGARS